jgi:hypothetical protein
VTQVVACSLPFGGFAWSRPIAVEIDNPAVRRLRVIDATRALQLLFWSIAAAAWLISEIIGKSERRYARGN